MEDDGTTATTRPDATRHHRHAGGPATIGDMATIGDTAVAVSGAVPEAVAVAIATATLDRVGRKLRGDALSQRQKRRGAALSRQRHGLTAIGRATEFVKSSPLSHTRSRCVAVEKVEDLAPPRDRLLKR